jgi:serine protease Do
MNAEAASYYNMPMGAYILEVFPGYCAHTAGIQAKDILLAVGPYEVTSVNTLSKALRKFQAGDHTTVTVYRGGKEIVMDIILDEKPKDTASETPQPEPNQESFDQLLPEGSSFEDYYNFFKDFFDKNGG